jgi:hypothetical protein
MNTTQKKSKAIPATGNFPSGCPTGIPYAFISFSMRATCPDNVIIPDSINLIAFGED